MEILLAASASNILVWIVWIVAALALLASGIAVVLFTNPFFSALALIGNLASLAVLYLLLAGEFVAGAQVIVYAGAIVIMFVFVLAYLGGRADAPWAGGPTLQNVTAIVGDGRDRARGHRRDRPQGRRQSQHHGDVDAAFGSPAEIGELFLSDHLLAFEVTSIVLLVAAVGGVILGSAMPTSEDEEEAA